MITIRQYSETRQQPYEAVRKQVDRLLKHDGFAEHVQTISGVRYLDDYLVSYLDQARGITVDPLAHEVEALQDKLDELKHLHWYQRLFRWQSRF